MNRATIFFIGHGFVLALLCEGPSFRSTEIGGGNHCWFLFLLPREPETTFTKPMRFGRIINNVPKYSIVVPFHNEEENVTALYDRVKLVMEQVGESFELVLVDDGSRDRTYRLLEEIAAVDSRVTVIKLRRNFGQTSALAAGFDRCPGRHAYLDGWRSPARSGRDSKFSGAPRRGYDVVSGWRAQRADNLLLRRIPSRCANWLMARLSGVDIHDLATTFKAYRRDVINNIPLYGEMHRFIPALASWYGASICEIPISNPQRQFGRSHYGISRTIRVMFDLMTIRFLLKYMTRPLHFFGSIGALGIAGGGIMSLWLLALKLLTGQHVMRAHSPLFMIAAVAILAGVQMLGIGLLGELQVRHFHAAAHRAPTPWTGLSVCGPARKVCCTKVGIHNAQERWGASNFRLAGSADRGGAGCAKSCR